MKAVQPAGTPGGLRTPPRPADGDGDPTLTTADRRILTGLAQCPDGLAKARLLTIVGYAASGKVSTSFARLVSEGWADANGQTLTITDRGRAALGAFTPLPTGDALREWLLAGDKLGTVGKRLLAAICKVYPDDIAKADVLTEAKYAASGKVSTGFAKLIAYGFITSPSASRVRAAEELFS